MSSSDLGPVLVQTHLRDPHGVFRPIDEVSKVGRNVEGAIELRVGDRPVLTVDLWDDVGDLWCYIANMISDFADGRPTVETYFPDQPIRLELSVVTDNLVAVTVEIATEHRRAVASRGDLLQALCTAGLAFFDRLAEIGAPDPYAGARRTLTEEIGRIGREDQPGRRRHPSPAKERR